MIVDALITAMIETRPVPHNGDAADDVAVWVHPNDPKQSAIIGTDKKGGLAVYDLEGKQLHYHPDGHMNSVDLRDGFPLNGKPVTLIAASDREHDRIALYTIDPDSRKLSSVAARDITISDGRIYGLCLYRSAASGDFFVFACDTDNGMVEQWKLRSTGDGKVDAKKVRSFDVGTKTEGMVADDELGHLYVAEEQVGIWKYSAEPDAGEKRSAVDSVAPDGKLTPDIEGLALYRAAGGRGYLIASSQGSDDFVVYDRANDNPFITRFGISEGYLDGVSGTDGIEVCPVPLGADFPDGVFIAQDDSNQPRQNFKLVPWQRIANATDPPLILDPSADSDFKKPIVIEKGGTYTGRWQSLDPDTPAVTIATTQPVIIEGVTIRGRGDLIATAAKFEHANLTVRNSRGYGMNPNVVKRYPGRFVNIEHFNNVLIENNRLESTSGIYIYNYLGDYQSGTVKVLGNNALNIDGRYSDGEGGFLDFNQRTRRSDGVVEDGHHSVQFVQISNVRDVPNVEIAENFVVNEPANSRVEDVISIYKSGGTKDSPLIIRDNCIHGAYTIAPWKGSYRDDDYEYDWGYSGGGIMLGDVDASFVKAFGNTVLCTTNYGIAISAGHDCEFYGNTVLSCGRLEAGQHIYAQNTGVYIWDSYRRGKDKFYNNTARENLIGWMGKGGQRNDYWVPGAASFVNNGEWRGPVTQKSERTELQRWRERVRQKSEQRDERIEDRE